MSSVYRDPEKLLRELGVTEPAHIDVEAIAQYCGATVIYDSLNGSEARIIGYGDKAEITVNSKSQRARQRFSVGHELGHWTWDRGKATFSCDTKKITGRWSGTDPETVANKYASELLLPKYLFKPRATAKEVTFASVKNLAKIFETSLTATAIRLVQIGSYPAMVVCSGRDGRKWFIAGPDVERKLWPRNDLSRESLAFNLLSDSAAALGPSDVDADTWINHKEASKYVVREDSVKINSDTVLSLLWWKDESQIADLS